MASLRARLVAGLLALTAVGLLLLGGITYAEQRSFLLQRVDRQLDDAPHVMATALYGHGIGNRPVDGDGDDRPGGGPGGPGGAPNSDLPVGTYGEARSASGAVLGSTVIRLGQSVTVHPDLPAKLVAGQRLTVGGKDGDDTRYRVLAERVPNPSGGLTVVAVPLREVDQTLHRLLLVEGLVILAVLLILGIAARLVVRVGLLPLDRMAHTADAIAGGDLSRRISSTDRRTEVGRLGLALNAMLDRLERAFAERQASEDRLRRFLADASHELRTPLSSIRGYAELFRMGAASDEAATRRSMSRIEDEARRMGVLVEDLLTLARLDEIADAPHVDVDLAALARDAADDARASAPGRAIAVTANGSATVRGDAHQLRQVLANLLRNATVHTPDDTRIDVSVTRTTHAVRLEVRDHGPGLPPDADPTALFDRFWRAEGGRERGKDGAGLGLAIVAGIVDAHGGTVAAANAEGGGASFVVTLPA